MTFKIQNSQLTASFCAITTIDARVNRGRPYTFWPSCQRFIDCRLFLKPSPTVRRTLQFGAVNMDGDFCKERAKAVRAIAEMADPLVKRRLLELAAHYERRAGIGPVAAENEEPPCPSE